MKALRIITLCSLVIFNSSYHTNKDTIYEGIKMGIPYKIIIREVTTNKQKKIIRNIIDDAFTEINDVLNRWNKHSEIALWNTSKSTKPIKVSPLFIDIMHIAEKIYSISDGLYDPTLGKIIYQWKMALRLDKMLTEEEINTLKPSVGWEKIIIGKDFIQKKHPDLELDLDGICKGFLCDLLCINLRDANIKQFLVEWGGEIKAFGCPFKILSNNTIISLHNNSIASSGPSFQYFPMEIENKIVYLSHFINPQTLSPIPFERIDITHSATHSSCAIADGLATIPLLKHKIH